MPDLTEKFRRSYLLNRENKQFEIETFTITTKIKSGDIPES